jgi:hypothetical protein
MSRLINNIVIYINIYYTLRFYFPYLSLLAQPVNITLYGPGLDCLVFDSVPERYLHYYLDKKYNIAKSSCHFGLYGSIWTGPSPKKYMDLRSFGPYNMFLVTDRSIYCHMTLSAMNYLLYMSCMYVIICIIPLYNIYKEIRLVKTIPRDIYQTSYFPLNNIVFPSQQYRISLIRNSQDLTLWSYNGIPC